MKIKPTPCVLRILHFLQGNFWKGILTSFVCCIFLSGNAQPTEINGPIGSEAFGSSITVLPNGNFVVADPLFDLAGIQDVGAVYLYDGSTRTVISTLTGSQANDQVGFDGIKILNNGNYVIISSRWNKGTVTRAGAFTWCSATTGLSGTVSASNSLLGNNTYDLASAKIYPLANGNFFVVCSYLDDSGKPSTGSITWGNGTSGVSGAISTSNSLMGEHANDNIGTELINNTSFFELPNGNAVIISPYWDSPTNMDVGAVTWLNGTAPTTGYVSASNSLVGSNSYDFVGNRGVKVLSNSNYVVQSASWHNGSFANAGAITWCNGNIGLSGEINASNSLIGDISNSGNYLLKLKNDNYVAAKRFYDPVSNSNIWGLIWVNGTVGFSGTINNTNSLVGASSAVELSNGNYVAVGSMFDVVSNSTVVTTTYCNGTSGMTGDINASNSWLFEGSFRMLVPLTNGNYVVGTNRTISGSLQKATYATWIDGASASAGRADQSNSLYGNTTDPSWWEIIALKNGNYVFCNRYFTIGGIYNCGAVTLCDGTTGLTGAINSGNSLVGNADDRAGMGGVVELSNGNYVVSTPYWNEYGAVTWCSGTSPMVGLISSTNSLVGSQYLDVVGDEVLALSNGNYLVISPLWNNGSTANVGAVTVGNGTSGTSGVVSASNSLLGTDTDDRIGSAYDYQIMNNSNIVLINDAATINGIKRAGSVTWIDGTNGTTGVISASNSLVGTNANHYFTTEIYPNNTYSVFDPGWDSDGYQDFRAIAYADGNIGLTGTINACNSVLGRLTSGLSTRAYNPIHDHLLVGSAASNFIRFKSIKTVPQVTSSSPITSCGNGDVDLNIAVSHGTVNWYKNPTGGNPLYTGNPYPLSKLTANATYYASASDGDCVTETRTPVSLELKAVVSSIYDGSRCDPGPVNLSAQTTTGTINWYDAPSGGNLLGTGTTYTTPFLSAANSYWVEAVDGACTSITRKEVKAFILNNCITQLTTASCNKILSEMDEAINCDPIPGAWSYRYKVEHIASGYSVVSVRSANNNLFRLSWLNANPVKYGTTYTISVSAQVNGAWTAYGPICQVTTPPTKLDATSCGKKLISVNDNLSCYEVTAATSYRFRVVNIELALDEIIEPAGGMNFINLSLVPGIQTGKTYTISVAAMVGGSWQNYGSPCSVHVPSAAKLASNSCNVSIPTISAPLYAEVYPGATNYRYEIRNAADNSLLMISTKGNSDPLFRMSWLKQNLPQFNTTYAIRVSAMVNGFWTAYGVPCLVTTPAAINQARTDQELLLVEGLSVSMEIFPNPNQGQCIVRTNFEGILILYNELGQVIRRDVMLPENNLELVYEGLNAGIYFVHGSSDNMMITQKVVVY